MHFFYFHSSSPEHRDNVTLCTYRFVKEFTKGTESDWMVNLINHIKPSDVLEDKV